MKLDKELILSTIATLALAALALLGGYLCVIILLTIM